MLEFSERKFCYREWATKIVSIRPLQIWAGSTPKELAIMVQGSYRQFSQGGKQPIVLLPCYDAYVW